MRLFLSADNKSRAIGQIIQEASEFISGIVAFDDRSSNNRGFS